MSDTSPVVASGFDAVELELSDPFSISRKETETTPCVVIELLDEEGRTGVGSATPAQYYDESVESVERVLPALLEVVQSVGDPHQLQRIEMELEDCAPAAASARAAVSMAVHDLAAGQVGEPLYRRLGLDAERAPPTSYTVSIDTPARMADRASRIRSAGFPTLKVKLGTADDRARLDAVRAAAPDTTVRVDINGGWTVEETLTNLDWLEDAGVELLEQPVPAEDVDGLAEVAAESPVPVAADESCVTPSDVPRVADAADIVVVKLMKCGGVRPALRLIETAHAHGLDVMVGCMVESMASLAASCHLAPLAEYADLDSSLLLAADPFEGVDLSGGEIALGAVGAGTGARRRQNCGLDAHVSGSSDR